MKKMTTEEFKNQLQEVHVIGQKLVMVQVERAVDLDLPPMVGLLALYEIVRLQVNENMKRGHITRKDIRMGRVTSALLRTSASEEKHFIVSDKGTERVK